MSAGGLRLFVAADPPAEVRQQLAGWTQACMRAPGLRLQGADMLHITLAFLGAMPAADVEHVARLALGCARPVTGLELGAPHCLPRRRPRVVAVTVADPTGELGALRDDVTRSLEAGLGFEPETRRFHPHITIARMRPGAAPDLARATAPSPRARFDARSLTVYRSRLYPDGASYEALEHVALS